MSTTLKHLTTNIEKALFNMFRQHDKNVNKTNFKSLAPAVLKTDQGTNSITSDGLLNGEMGKYHDQNLAQDAKKLVNDGSSVICNSSIEGKQVEYSYPTPVIFNDLIDRYLYYGVHKEREYNWGVLGFEVDKFFSYGAYFCKYEAEDKKLEIISVGFGNGVVENEITTIYPSHFGNEVDVPNITLVDLDPKSETEFKTVDDLLVKRPDLVGNCVLFLIWPEPEFENNDDYDIDAICKLQPCSVLTLYETTGLSGSSALQTLLDKKSSELKYYQEKNPGVELNNYSIKEVACQEVTFGTNDKWKFLFEKNDETLKPEACVFKLKVATMKKSLIDE